MQNRLVAEIVGLHQFIQNWLEGTVPQDGDNFSRFNTALDDDFMIVHPTGKTEHRDQLTSSFWSAHASNKGLSIEIRNCRYQFSFGPCSLLTYEEWQYGPTTTARSSSVVLRVADDGTNIKWAHLHETWMAI